MTPHDLEVIRFKLLGLFQVVVKPSVNMLGNDNQASPTRPGSKPLLPDSYCSGAIADIRKLPLAQWLLFVYHPETRQCPEDLAIQLLIKAIENVQAFQPSKRERLANLAVIAAMDVRQELLGGEKCTIQMVCDLAGVYIHNWQRDYRDHFKNLKSAALNLDAEALQSAAAVFNGQRKQSALSAIDIHGGVY